MFYLYRIQFLVNLLNLFFEKSDLRGIKGNTLLWIAALIRDSDCLVSCLL